MPAERKITDADLARLRNLADDGWSRDDLAAAFGITQQHVGRLVRGDQRPDIAAPGAQEQAEDRAGGDGVSPAVERFLAATELGPESDVLGETARALAGKLDGCSASTAVAAAQAAPRIAAQLIDVLERLQAEAKREPDGIDLLRQQHVERRARLREARD
jgi:transcriptional regulator with XRE-family HTH domain